MEIWQVFFYGHQKKPVNQEDFICLATTARYTPNSKVCNTEKPLAGIIKSP
jgi:hypothetical protein